MKDTPFCIITQYQDCNVMLIFVYRCKQRRQVKLSYILRHAKTTVQEEKYRYTPGEGWGGLKKAASQSLMLLPVQVCQTLLLQ